MIMKWEPKIKGFASCYGKVVTIAPSLETGKVRLKCDA